MKNIRNKQVVRRFVQGDTGHDGYGAVSSRDDKLYSYNARIAEWNDGEIVVYDGWDGYSQTTSEHFKYLRDALDSSSVEWHAAHEPSNKGRQKARWY